MANIYLKKKRQPKKQKQNKMQKIPTWSTSPVWQHNPNANEFPSSSAADPAGAHKRPAEALREVSDLCSFVLLHLLYTSLSSAHASKELTPSSDWFPLL